MAPIGGSFGFGPMGGSHGGALADLLLVPAADHLLVPAPAGIPASTLATLPNNVVDGYRSVGPPLAAQPAADVLIVAGAPGSIALYAAAAAVALSAATSATSTQTRTAPRPPPSAPTRPATTAPGPGASTRQPITVDVTGDAAWPR